MTSTIVQPPLQPGQTQFNPLPIRSQLALKGVVSEVLPSKAIPPTSNQLRPINPSNHSNESNLQTLILSQPPTGTPTTPLFPPCQVRQFRLPLGTAPRALWHRNSVATVALRCCCAVVTLPTRCSAVATATASGLPNVHDELYPGLNKGLHGLQYT